MVYTWRANASKATVPMYWLGRRFCPKPHTNEGTIQATGDRGQANVTGTTWQKTLLFTEFERVHVRLVSSLQRGHFSSQRSCWDFRKWQHQLERTANGSGHTIIQVLNKLQILNQKRQTVKSLRQLPALKIHFSVQTNFSVQFLPTKLTVVVIIHNCFLPILGD